MKENATNLKIKLEALLKPNPHKQERYLACCTILLKSQPSMICEILEHHPDFFNFVFKLIQWDNNDSYSDFVMKRVGLRVLYLYLSDTQCDGNTITTQDWRFLIGILAKHCQENVTIHMLDIELIQIFNLVIDKAMNKKDSVISFGVDPNDLITLPDLMMNRFIISASGQQHDESCKTDKPKHDYNGVDIYGDIMEFLKKLLDSDNQDIQDLTTHDLFCDNMILFLASYASAIQSKCYKYATLKTEKIVTVGFVKSTIRLLFGDKHHLLLTDKISHHLPILLHYALLVFLSQDLSFKNDSVLQKEIEKFRDKDDDNDDLISLLQKLVLSGITSLLDSTRQNHKETILELESIKTMIRPMTINILATLFERFGHEWTKPYDGNSAGILGRAGYYCTIMRLVAGELRIGLGRIVDFDQSIKAKDGNNINSTETQDSFFTVAKNDSEVFHTCRDCIRIGLLALKHMLDLASDADDKLCADSFDFNTDSILHIRHTLEDVLNSCIQFILEEANPRVFIYWNDCAYECCRFIGAYLSQMNIFDYDYDVMENDRDDDHNYTHNSHSAQIDTVTILRAIKQAMDICFVENDKQDETSYNRAVTIFPCLLSILTCCDESRHASLVAKYLFQSTYISSTIEKILTLIELRNEKNVSYLYENLDIISWCCFLITAMVEFQSTNPKQVSTKIMDKQSMASTLSRVSEQYFERTQQDGMDPQVKIDSGNILVMLLDTWNTVMSSTGDHLGANSSNNVLMVNVKSFLQSKGIL